MEPLLTIIATAHNEDRTHSPLMDSMLAQTDKNWKLIVCNNGPRLLDWGQPVDSRISYVHSDKDTAMWGCRNRQEAIDYRVNTGYVLNTSVQDYYLPCFIQEVNDILKDKTVDIVHWQAINHLFRYNVLNGEFAWGHIDWGQWCCRTEHIKKTGIVQPDNFSGDFHTLQAVRKYARKTHKLDKILTIHN